MTENKQFRLVNELGDYHIKDGDDELCYDLCSPSMAKENWNNVVNRLNELAEENEEFRKRTKELIAVSLDYPTINLDLIAEAIKSLRELIE